MTDRPHLLCTTLRLAPGTLQWLGLGEGFENQLAHRGIAIDLVDQAHAPLDGIAAVLLHDDDGPEASALRHMARAAGVPILRLSDSWLPAAWRLGEEQPGAADGADTRLHRLVETFGRHLAPEAIDALVSALPSSPDTWQPGAEGLVRTVATDQSADGWAVRPALRELDTVLALHGFSSAPCDGPGSALLVAGNTPAAWQALMQGRELICASPSPFAGLGLTHDAPGPGDLPLALGSLAAGRRNRRDATRRALATEAQFNAIQRDAGALTAALDEAIRAIGRRPRRPVSIIVNNYNYREFVGSAIESALRQSVPAHEVIVVDDGSTDGSDQLIAATAGIVPVVKSNGGQASAFNAGFARATGDVIVFLDADDRLLPDAVEQIGSADLRGVSRLQFGLETIDTAGQPTGLYVPGTPGNPVSSGELAGALLADGIFPFMPTSGNAFPRPVLQALLPMPETEWRLCADLYLVLASALLGEAADRGTVLGQYRVHGRNGYFRMLGGEPYLQDARLALRLRGWRALGSHLARWLPRPEAQRFRMALHRHILTETVRSARRRPAAILSETLRAFGLAATSSGLSPSRRMAHALAPFRRVWGLARREARSQRGDDDQPQPAAGMSVADLVDCAGTAAWPHLAPGYQQDLTNRYPCANAFGRGWGGGLGERVAAARRDRLHCVPSAAGCSPLAAQTAFRARRR